MSKSKSLSVIKLPFYIYGEERYDDSNSFTREDIYGEDIFEIHRCGKWDLLAALEDISMSQQKLAAYTIPQIVKALKKTMDYFFDLEEEFEIVIRATGSPSSFVKEKIEFVKNWVRTIEEYIDQALPTKNASYRPTRPIIATLPRNSEQVAVYVLIQALLSRNAILVRPSNEAASSYIAIEFVRALNQAIDALGEDYDGLRQAITVVNTDYEQFFPNLSVEGFNYILFGHDTTIDRIKNDLRQEKRRPRKVLGYGVGLSKTILFADWDLDADLILDSIAFNAGNECESTDILYVEQPAYESVLKKLKKRAEKARSTDPFEADSIGLVHAHNIDYVQSETIKRGKEKHLAITEEDGTKRLHVSVIPLTRYESSMEYPGPVVSVRAFEDIEDLRILMQRDLQDNQMRKNLVTSVFTDSERNWKEVVPILNSHTVRRNKPTHQFNINMPHQGMYLLRELVEPVYLDE